MVVYSMPGLERGFNSPHQKCDAKQPCTTCVNGDRAVECMYELCRRSRSTNVNGFPPSRDDATGALCVRTLPSQTSPNRFSFSEPPIRPPSLLTWSISSESASSLSPSSPACERLPTPTAQKPSARIHGEMTLRPPSDVSPARRTRCNTECVTCPIASSFTVLPSACFRTIPQPLQVPFKLSIIPPERMRVSCITGSDLDMTLCVLFRLVIFHQVVETKL